MSWLSSRTSLLIFLVSLLQDLLMHFPFQTLSLRGAAGAEWRGLSIRVSRQSRRNCPLTCSGCDGVVPYGNRCGLGGGLFPAGRSLEPMSGGLGLEPCPATRGEAV